MKDWPSVCVWTAKNDLKTARKELPFLSADLVNSHNSSQETALHIAVEKLNLVMLNLLLTHPLIDVNKRDSIGRTPLFLAAFRGNIPMCTALLRAGADWRISSFDGDTTLKVSSIVMHGLNNCVNVRSQFTALVRQAERKRVFDYAFGLVSLDLPVLIVLCIIEFCGVESDFIGHKLGPNKNQQWRICKALKDAFKSNRLLQQVLCRRAVIVVVHSHRSKLSRKTVHRPNRPST